MSEVLMKIGGVPVYLDPDGSVHFVGEFTIDCDGCPMAYGPDGCLPEPYDFWQMRATQGTGGGS